MALCPFFGEEVAQVRLAPHKRSYTLAHTMQVRTGDPNCSRDCATQCKICPNNSKLSFRVLAANQVSKANLFVSNGKF